MMNVLSISNSFGVDGTRYLHQIARADGVKLNVATLFIGGCVLERHYRNMLAENRNYTLYFNGHNTEFFVSIQEALLSRAWDVVVLQQGSVHSAKPECYEPYGSALAELVRECVPHAKLMIQQTWAYPQGSDRLLNLTPYTDSGDMFRDIEKAYALFAENIQADGIIPSGHLVQQLQAKGLSIETVYRDSLHVSLGLGRYALGLLWYRLLTGKSVSENTFCDFDTPIDPAHIALAKTLVDDYRTL